MSSRFTLSIANKMNKINGICNLLILNAINNRLKNERFKKPLYNW
jgi:hypothetical protein